jgi:uncharacterized phage-associated protein
MRTEIEPPYDARAVANWVLEIAEDRDIELTQMQVLKILYFANGWYLATCGLKLIQQDFQAWEYGPVIRVVRDSFKEFGSGPIKRKAEKLDIFTGELEEVKSIENVNDRFFLEKVFETYHAYGAWELSDMTHEPGSPWDQVWNSREPIGRLGLKLTDDSIKRYFLSLASRQSLN